MPYKARLKTGEPRKRPKPNYAVSNAHEYNESLKRRGQLSLYCPNGALSRWRFRDVRSTDRGSAQAAADGFWVVPVNFTPGFEAIGEVFAIKRSAQQVTFEGKVLPDGTEAGQERLRALRVAKPTHTPLALTRGLMAVLGAIVHASAGFDEHVLDVGQLRHVGLRGRVAAQLIGDDLLRGTGQERSTRWKMIAAGKRWP